VWDSGGGSHATIAEIARISRKNSAQLDSCSSSSDVSLAIAEVSERLRKSCSLQHSSSIGWYSIILFIENSRSERNNERTVHSTIVKIAHDNVSFIFKY
jgi:hypothetical protein